MNIFPPFFSFFLKNSCGFKPTLSFYIFNIYLISTQKNCKFYKGSY